MKINFKTVSTIAIVIAITILFVRLYKIEKQASEIDRLVQSGQLKCKKPN